jgi:hypothetical protein
MVKIGIVNYRENEKLVPSVVLCVRQTESLKEVKINIWQTESLKEIKINKRLRD